MNSSFDFYRDKKIFITGHTGFKGTWLTHTLNQLGAKIKGYALPPEDKSLFNLLNTASICEHFENDIRSKELIKKELLSFEPDFIFHLAAQPLVIDSYKRPVYTFEVNLMGTIYLLDAIRELKNPCTTLVITTDKVYEDQHQKNAYNESDKLGGYDPYSASKTTVEFAVNSYRNSFFNQADYLNHGKTLATARAGNVIGGGDFSLNRIFPDIINSLIVGDEIFLRNPNSVRPWQHVLDALNGYLTLAQALHDNPEDKILNNSWNFGPKEEDIFTVEELAKRAIRYWGNGSYSVQENASNLKETELLRLDASKANSLLNWVPKWSADLAIKNTIEWYQNMANKKLDFLELTTNQISNYLAS